jgi:hypothetical protein
VFCNKQLFSNGLAALSLKAIPPLQVLKLKVTPATVAPRDILAL